jgi:hypothetical protein
MENWFNGQFRGLAAIVAEYAEFNLLAIEGAKMRYCLHHAAHDVLVLFGDTSVKTAETTWLEHRKPANESSVAPVCNWCYHKEREFIVPYPTSENVVTWS